MEQKTYPLTNEMLAIRALESASYLRGSITADEQLLTRAWANYIQAIESRERFLALGNDKSAAYTQAVIKAIADRKGPTGTALLNTRTRILQMHDLDQPSHLWRKDHQYTMFERPYEKLGYIFLTRADYKAHVSLVRTGEFDHKRVTATHFTREFVMGLIETIPYKAPVIKLERKNK